MRTHLLSGFTALTLLTGCGVTSSAFTSPPLNAYGPSSASMSGLGYDALQLGPQNWRVWYTGNAHAREALPRMEAGIRYQCANCFTRELPNPLVCKQCRAAAYCSKACQKLHWKKGGHKKACKERNKYLPEEE